MGDAERREQTDEQVGIVAGRHRCGRLGTSPEAAEIGEQDGVLLCQKLRRAAEHLARAAPAVQDQHGALAVSQSLVFHRASVFRIAHRFPPDP